MTKMSKDEIQHLLEKNPHLVNYVEDIKRKIGDPVFYSPLPREVGDEKHPNLIYPTRGMVFIHIYRTQDMEVPEYKAIEPILNDAEKEKLKQIQKLIVKKAPEKRSVVEDNDLKEILTELIDEITIIDEKATDIQKDKKGNAILAKGDKVKVTSIQKRNIEYSVIKELVGGGAIECFMGDPYIEDIHLISGENIHLIHKVFEMIKTNVLIEKKDAPAFTKLLSEKMGVPVSEGRPIVDGVLPDGSRGNIIYSSAVSIKGPSMTIRRFTETPISITQLINWGTLSSGVASYLWICLQYGRSFFLCGGTACGKTTTMNAIIPFIPPEKKIYTTEGTPELQVPHTVWQRLLTKATGPKEGQVDMFDLLRAALRSRPDYIIPGEVRGAEGNIVFQAMQTGHPCMTTFHAGTVTKVIQRFTGDPINVPKTFMDNLDFVVIQLALERNGKMMRRVTSIDEIEGYNRAVDGIMARKAFDWKAEEDRHVFAANKNSYILEEKIAKNAGYEDTAGIYDEYDLRKHILDKMVEEKIFDYYEVVQCIWGFYREGEEGLPFSL
ncbi:ATPase, type IV secretory pathway VirB11 component like protein [Thermoplasmatales archaeon SCGC AB-540-F20]|nr:ATPase, type IV secretory pathway VirB11 component like protein [Thermoplasmatales archaeon SCGC AB-540-F20]